MRLLHPDFSTLGTSPGGRRHVRNLGGGGAKSKKTLPQFSFGNLGRDSFAAIPLAPLT